MKRSSGGNHMSIRTRAMLTQFVLILLPIVLCSFLLIRQVFNDSLSTNAGATYQYNRYIVDNLNTAIRQLESMANTISANRSVRQYVGEPDPAVRDELYRSGISNLLSYSYNRYLPTHDIQVIPDAMLSDVSAEDDTYVFYHSEYRMWFFRNEGNELTCKFYYQFVGDNDKTGLICFVPTGTILTDIQKSIASINDQQCAITDEKGNFLYLPDTISEKDTEILTNAIRRNKEGYQLLGNSTVFYCMRSDLLPLQFVSIQPMLVAWQFSSSLLPYLIGTLLLTALCIFLSYQVFFKGITRRIIQLSDACESLPLDRIVASGSALSDELPEEEQPLLPSVPVMGSDEIGTLSVSINNMLSHIVELTDINAQEVRTSQRAAYDMLAAQIHPHFIYNTLENLRMMAEINDDQEVADQLYALGRMLRLSISDSSSTGDVRTELEHAGLYLQLQKMRMSNGLIYEVDPVSDEIASFSCPRFLLQPVVENAIKHGFQNKKTPGYIHITAGKNGDEIWLQVYNDGWGLSEERLNEVRESLRHNQPIRQASGGIGLVNVSTRLRMFYGRQAGLTIDSDPAGGTTCTLHLGPAPAEEQ